MKLTTSCYFLNFCIDLLLKDILLVWTLVLQVIVLFNDIHMYDQNTLLEEHSLLTCQ